MNLLYNNISVNLLDLKDIKYALSVISAFEGGLFAQKDINYMGRCEYLTENTEIFNENVEKIKQL